jgi:nucleoside-diphosphate-sugar epimerase
VKLALLDATGGVGREVLNQAIAAGHSVTGVVRNPSKLPADVDVVRQDLATPDADVLAAAMRDVDAVISAVGPHRAAQAGIVAPATTAITNAMGCAGVRRLVVISAAPVGVVPSTYRPHPPPYDPGDDLLMRYLLSPLIRRLFGRHYTDPRRHGGPAARREPGLDCDPATAAHQRTAHRHVPNRDRPQRTPRPDHLAARRRPP